MADQEATAIDHSAIDHSAMDHAAMDYDAHEHTYAGFIKLTKWSIAITVLILVGLTLLV